MVNYFLVEIINKIKLMCVWCIWLIFDIFYLFDYKKKLVWLRVVKLNKE